MAPPASRLSAKHRLPIDASSWLSRRQGDIIRFGDFNFVAGGETQHDTEGEPITSDHTMAAVFDDAFEGLAELVPLDDFPRMACDIGGPTVTTASHLFELGRVFLGTALVTGRSQRSWVSIATVRRKTQWRRVQRSFHISRNTTSRTRHTSIF